MSETEARSQARSLLADIRKGRESVPTQPAEIAFEAVADEVFSHYRRHWKPRTFAVNLNYYQNNILPWFKGRRIADITRREVLEWFESLHAKPASANRSLPVLSVILRQAEVYGYRPEDCNPCKDIKRYRRRARERFLSPDEIRRVVEVLNRYDETRPFQAAVIRLLLLTGCRKGELLTLRWRDYREGKLFLRDSKSGPRTVWLSSAAREVLDRLPRKSAWTFPSHWRNLDHLSGITDFWQRRADGSRPARCPAARSQAHLRQHRPHAWRNRADHRPVAGARPSGDHAQIHQLRRCGGPGGGRYRLIGPSEGLSHGKEDQADRWKDRKAQSRGYRVHGLGYPYCRVRGPGQADGAQELRVSPPRGRPIPEVHAWAGVARERRRSPARLYEGLGQNAVGETGEGADGAQAPLFRDFVAGSWRAACYEPCKQSTKTSKDWALNSQLLPVLAPCRLTGSTGQVLSDGSRGTARQHPAARTRLCSCSGRS